MAMTYREMVIETIKLACQDLIDRAEILIPQCDSVCSTRVTLTIPTLSDNSNDLPGIKVEVDALPNRTTFEKMYDLTNGFRYGG